MVFGGCDARLDARERWKLVAAFAVQIGMLFDVREIDVSGDFFALWSQLIALAHLLWIGGGDGGGYAHAPQHIWGLLLVSRDAGAYQSCNSSAMVLYYATILLLLLLAYFIASRITAALLWFVRAR
jgi:hypothetical protein